MSGNGTRIAARWLAERTGAEVVIIRVGPREVAARMLGGGLVEQDLGAVEVCEPEELDGIRFTPVSVGNPHAVVEGDPAELPRLGPLLETHPRFPERTNVQVARPSTARRSRRGCGSAAWGRRARRARAPSRSPRRSAPSPATVRFPGGDLVVRLDGGRAYLTGPAERVEEPGEAEG